MAKFTLDTNDINEPDYLLIGISSHAKSYRLCWALNQQLGFKFNKSEFNIEIKNVRKKTTSVFEVYEYFDEDNRVYFYLIGNKSNDSYLLPELKHVDYLLMLKENLTVDIALINEKVKLTEHVLTSFVLSANSVTSHENLVF